MEREELLELIEELENNPSKEELECKLGELTSDDLVYAGNMILSELATKAINGAKIDSEIIILIRDLVNKANFELRELATKDPLTKLHNRNQLKEMFKQEQLRMKRDPDYVFSILIVDIDFFKKFNDTYGHNAGDEVLKHFARIITENVRGTDGAFRYGGEEFVIIYSGTKSSEAHRAAKYLKSYMADSKIEFTDESGTVHEKTITFSGGIAQVKVDDSLESAIERADKLLYKAKESGRNNVLFE